jgi:hypothetical protein
VKERKKNLMLALYSRDTESSSGLLRNKWVEVKELTEIELKSLILAQIERWRHALHMQVER